MGEDQIFFNTIANFQPPKRKKFQQILLYSLCHNELPRPQYVRTLLISRML